MLKRKSSRKVISRRRPDKKKKNSRMMEMAIVAILALVIIYGASFAIRITNGFSKTVETPEYVLRLQILNGCGADGAAGRVAKALPDLIKLPLEVIILEVDDFDSYYVDKTFLISRENDNDPVEILADQLNLPNDNIRFEPIDNNYQSISATLVLGEDFESIWGDKK